MGSGGRTNGRIFSCRQEKILPLWRTVTFRNTWMNARASTRTVLTRKILVAKKFSWRCGLAVTKFLAPGGSDRTNSCRQVIVLPLRRCVDEIPGTWAVLTGQILVARKLSCRCLVEAGKLTPKMTRGSAG